MTMGRTLTAALARGNRALAEFRITGVETNLAWLRALLARPELAAQEVSTRSIETHAAALAQSLHECGYFVPVERALMLDLRDLGGLG